MAFTNGIRNRKLNKGHETKLIHLPEGLLKVVILQLKVENYVGLPLWYTTYANSTICLTPNFFIFVIFRPILQWHNLFNFI